MLQANATAAQAAVRKIVETGILISIIRRNVRDGVPDRVTRLVLRGNCHANGGWRC
jgi:hypothetical protein